MTHPKFHWTPQKRTTAVYVGMGYSDSKIYSLLGFGPETLKRWREFPEFNEYCDTLSETHRETMQSLLEDGERKAVITLIELTEAKDEEVRLKSAESLLNRAGKRGKPIEKQEVQSMELKGDMTEALTRALRDPGVVERLAAKGFLALPVPENVPRPAERAEGVSPTDDEVDYETVVEVAVGGGTAGSGSVQLPAHGADDGVRGSADRSAPSVPDVVGGD